GPARGADRLRCRHPAGEPVRACPGDPRRTRRRVRPRGNGPPRPRVRAGRGRPADRHSPLRGGSSRAAAVPVILEIVFWASAGALVWTHVGYPAAAAVAARVRRRPVRAADTQPSVTAIVAAWHEEAVIE